MLSVIFKVYLYILSGLLHCLKESDNLQSPLITLTMEEQNNKSADFPKIASRNLLHVTINNFASSISEHASVQTDSLASEISSES
jgi:hypothetical protein